MCRSIRRLLAVLATVLAVGTGLAIGGASSALAPDQDSDRGRLVRVDVPADGRDQTSPNGRYRVVGSAEDAVLVDVQRRAEFDLPEELGVPGSEQALDITDAGVVVGGRPEAAAVTVVDAPGGTTRTVRCGDLAQCGYVRLVSPDGRYAAAMGFTGELWNSALLLYVLDLATGAVHPVRSCVAEYVPDLALVGFTGDGRLVLDRHPFSDCDDEGARRGGERVFFDVATGAETPLLPGGGRAPAVISADGRFYTWRTEERVVPDDRDRRPDVYQLDVSTGSIAWVSRPRGDGSTRRRSSSELAASPSGRFVVFGADARSATGGGNARHLQVVLWDQRTDRLRVVSRARDGAAGRGDSKPSTVADDRTVTFLSEAPNLPGGFAGGDEPALYRWRP